MELSQQLTLLADELLDAHDDTLRLAADLVFDDWRWDAHLCYLRELRRAGREALDSAWDCGRPAAGRSRVLAQRQFQSNLQRRGARRCARNGHGEGPT
jgi:hypothetical protein